MVIDFLVVTTHSNLSNFIINKVIFHTLLNKAITYDGADVFNKFKDCSSGTFKEEIIGDVRGMLSFYDSAQLRIKGETILD